MGLGKKLSVAVAASFMSLSISLPGVQEVISLKRIKQISSPKTRLRNQNSLHQMTRLSSSF